MAKLRAARHLSLVLVVAADSIGRPAVWGLKSSSCSIEAAEMLVAQCFRA